MLWNSVHEEQTKKSLKLFNFFLYLSFQNNFLKEFNAIHDEKLIKFPPRINYNELQQKEYSILNVVYVSTQVHEKSVIVRIEDGAGQARSLVLPEKYAETFRRNFEDPFPINCDELCLEFKGWHQKNPATLWDNF